MTNYIILLPPSESKKTGGDETKPLRLIKNFKKDNYFETLWIEREEIYGKLRETISKSTHEELEKILDLKGKNLQNAIEINSDLLNKETMPAIERYDGVMFKAIEYNKLNEKQKENFNNSTIFIDGMFGLLRPQDKIPEYKLKINSKFSDIDITKYWKQNLIGLFHSLFKEKIIIDILPETHRKVVTIPSDSKYYQIKFMIEKNGKNVNVGHDSKKLKGELIQYISNKEQITRKYLEEFKHKDGYIFNEKLSNENEIVYYFMK